MKYIYLGIIFGVIYSIFLYFGNQNGKVLFLFVLILLMLFLSIKNKGNEVEDTGILEHLNEDPLGILDYYVVDSEKCYGLFVVLLGNKVFVDIREDKLIKERKEYAKFLFINNKELEKNFASFVENNQAYKEKKIAYIGLHSKNNFTAEIFWDPDGYTNLEGLNWML